MRKLLAVIGGQTYDTETATEVAVFGLDLPRHNPRWYEERLFRTSEGLFFLCGEGGPGSKWANTYLDSSRTYGWGLLPLEDSEARGWLEENGKSEELERLLGGESVKAREEPEHLNQWNQGTGNRHFFGT